MAGDARFSHCRRPDCFLCGAAAAIDYDISKEGAMIKAIVSNGVIVPRDPLPDDWQEGTEVAVERVADGAAQAQKGARADVWMDEVEAVAQQGDPQDDQRLSARLFRRFAVAKTTLSVKALAWTREAIFARHQSPSC
jgi:hypothetical protein